eukprot:3936449-Rhodomonas_salina.2
MRLVTGEESRVKRHGRRGTDRCRARRWSRAPCLVSAYPISGPDGTHRMISMLSASDHGS